MCTLADDEQIERMALAKRVKSILAAAWNISEAVAGEARPWRHSRREKARSWSWIYPHLPEMNGVEAAEHIRSLDEDCIIIFLTAYDEFSYAKRAIVIRALDYLLKPCGEELVAVMEEAMRLTDKRLAGQGASGPDSPGPYITGPDVRAGEPAQAMSRDDEDASGPGGRNHAGIYKE